METQDPTCLTARSLEFKSTFEAGEMRAQFLASILNDNCIAMR